MGHLCWFCHIGLRTESPAEPCVPDVCPGVLFRQRGRCRGLLTPEPLAERSLPMVAGHRSVSFWNSAAGHRHTWSRSGSICARVGLWRSRFDKWRYEWAPVRCVPDPWVDFNPSPWIQRQTSLAFSASVARAPQLTHRTNWISMSVNSTRTLRTAGPPRRSPRTDDGSWQTLIHKLPN